MSTAIRKDEDLAKLTDTKARLRVRITAMPLAIRWATNDSIVLQSCSWRRAESNVHVETHGRARFGSGKSIDSD